MAIALAVREAEAGKRSQQSVESKSQVAEAGQR
jgi:hypothetical protein